MTESIQEGQQESPLPRVVRAAFSTQGLMHLRPDHAPDPKIGFDIGWDHARLGVSLAPELLDCKPVADGFRAGREHWSATTSHDRHLRKWLLLRLSAWRRNRAIAEDVTADFLRDIDVTHCPITREAMTHGTRQDSDASVDRINNDLGYTRGNIVMVSVRANKAKGSQSAVQIMRQAREVEAEGPGATRMGLNALQWSRLGTLAALGEVFPDPMVALQWPLVVLPPPGVGTLDSGFSVKTLMSVVACTGHGEKQIESLIRGKAARRQYTQFSRCLRQSTRRANGRLNAMPREEETRCSIADGWLAPLVNAEWRKLVPHLLDIGIDRIVLNAPHMIDRRKASSMLDAGAHARGGYLQ